jgi:hypothetical protein
MTQPTFDPDMPVTTDDGTAPPADYADTASAGTELPADLPAVVEAADATATVAATLEVDLQGSSNY